MAKPDAVKKRAIQGLFKDETTAVNPIPEKKARLTVEIEPDLLLKLKKYALVNSKTIKEVVKDWVINLPEE